MPNKHQTPQYQIPLTGKVRWNQIAAYMPISKETARKLSIDGKFPPRIRFSTRCTMFDAAEINRWLESPQTYTAPQVNGGH